MANPSPIQLVQGPQIWELYATDKFGLSQDDVIDDKLHGLGVSLDAILSRAASGQPSQPEPWQEIGTGGATFRIGSARPVQVLSIAKTEPTLPAGKLIADRSSYPGDSIPTVVGQTPWYVVIELWWRAPNTTVPWPAFTSLFPALPDLDTIAGAEWVLAKAIVPNDPGKDPGDMNWSTAQGKRIASGAMTVMQTIAVVGAVIAVVMLVASRKTGRR